MTTLHLIVLAVVLSLASAVDMSPSSYNHVCAKGWLKNGWKSWHWFPHGNQGCNCKGDVYYCWTWWSDSQNHKRWGWGCLGPRRYGVHHSGSIHCYGYSFGTNLWWNYGHRKYCYCKFTNCARGQHKTDMKSNGGNPCRSCQPGQYQNSDQYEGVVCKICQPGQYSASSGSHSCTGCPSGRMQDSTGANKCTKCSKGTYSNGNGRTSCTDCPRGWRNDNVDQASCKQCGAAEYMDTVGGADSTCKSCPRGWYNENTLQAGCKQCSVGKYQENERTTGCSACKPGSFQNQPGGSNINCIQCAEGKYCCYIFVVISLLSYMCVFIINQF